MTDLTRYPYPGKFEGELALAPFAYAETLDGCGEEYDFGDDTGYVDHYVVCTGPLEVTAAEAAEHDLTAADVDFAGRLLGFIVHVDNYGFVDVSWYEQGEEVAMARAVGRLDTAMGEHERECDADDE